MSGSTTRADRAGASYPHERIAIARHEFVLSHDGSRWHAAGEGMTVSGGSLTEVEHRLQAALDPGPRELTLRFDVSRMPQWLRRYQPHYFNYTLRIGPAA